jgi:ribosomal protein S18 acetylase RimI-like enzyme
LTADDWIIERADEADVEALFALQRIAFLSEAEVYRDYHIHPLVETLDEALADFRQQVVYKAVVCDRIVGSVRAHLEGDTCHVGRLMVHPEFRGRGLGVALMNRIEEHFANARRFALFTGEASEGNLRLYGRLGYREYDRRPVTDAVTMRLMEKIRPEGAPTN